MEWIHTLNDHIQTHIDFYPIFFLVEKQIAQADRQKMILDQSDEDHPLSILNCCVRWNKLITNSIPGVTLYQMIFFFFFLILYFQMKKIKVFSIIKFLNETIKQKRKNHPWIWPISWWPSSLSIYILNNKRKNRINKNKNP